MRCAAAVLSVFEVARTRDAGCRATNSVSGTRINLRLIDMPQHSTRQYGKRESWLLAPSLRWRLRGAPHPSSLTVALEWLHVPRLTSSDERFPQVIETRPAPIGGSPNRTVVRPINSTTPTPRSPANAARRCSPSG